jgi:soluble lytic murein transglycosylase-like protein
VEGLIRAISLAAFLMSAGCSDSDGGAAAQVSQKAPGTDTTTVADNPAKAIVLRARAFDRADNLDSARALYEEGAKKAPLIKDWLLLRAAGVTKDKSARDNYFGDVELAVVKDRIRPTEAIALERSGDVEGAIAAYSAIGDRLATLRLRMMVPSDTARMLESRRALIAFLANPGSAQNARDGLGLFDKVYKDPSPAENLVIARAALAGGLASRAASSYSKAFAAKLGTARDYFDDGMMLARLDRDNEAVLAFDRVTTPASLAAAAKYQRARALLALGRREVTRAALNDVTVKFPKDTSAASALLLLADLATDENRDAAARSAFVSLARRFPATRHAPAALFRAGMIAYVMGDYKAAANELDSVVAIYPNADDALAAGYWSGRSWKARGDTAQANKRWSQVIAKEGGSYYSVQSARRLDVPLLADRSYDNKYPEIRDVDDATRRIAILKDFGMDTEVKFEYDRLYTDATSTPEKLVATASALAGTDQSTRSITLGRRAVEQVGPSAQNYRLVYPVLERETLIESSKQNGLDPVLVASLIRQESNFNPKATSPVGARGLMQVMPAVGRTLAKSKGIEGYNDDSLYDPAVNIRLGTAHLSGLFRRTSSIERVLAAYNAGESRVTRWMTKTGAQDPEVFIERIPFVETRDYVRSIVRNRAFYSLLYQW